MSPRCKIVSSLDLFAPPTTITLLLDAFVCVCELGKLLGNKRIFLNSPDPATPTVAAPAPMNLAAESISRVAGEVWKLRTCGRSATGVECWAANVWLCEMTALLKGRSHWHPLATYNESGVADVRKVMFATFPPLRNHFAFPFDGLKFTRIYF